MKLKEKAVRYLTKAELEAFKAEEHAERVALTRRVARGEITALEANREASIFAYVPSILETPIDFVAEAHRQTAKPRRKHHGSRAKTTVRS